MKTLTILFDHGRAVDVKIVEQCMTLKYINSSHRLLFSLT